MNTCNYAPEPGITTNALFLYYKSCFFFFFRWNVCMCCKTHTILLPSCLVPMLGRPKHVSYSHQPHPSQSLYCRLLCTAREEIGILGSRAWGLPKGPFRSPVQGCSQSHKGHPLTYCLIRSWRMFAVPEVTPQCNQRPLEPGHPASEGIMYFHFLCPPSFPL